MKHTKDAVVEVTPQVIPTSKTVSHFTGGYGEIRPYQDITYYARMTESDYARLKHITPIPLNNYTSPPKASTGKIIKIRSNIQQYCRTSDSLFDSGVNRSPLQQSPGEVANVLPATVKYTPISKKEYKEAYLLSPQTSWQNGMWRNPPPLYNVSISNVRLGLEADSKFFVNNHGFLCCYGKDKPISIANFIVKFTGMVKVVQRHSSKTMVEAVIKGRKAEATKEFELGEISRLLDILRETHPEFYVTSSPNAKNLLGEYISEAFEMQMSDKGMKTRYEVSGWQKEDEGKFRYVSGRDKDCCSNRILPALDSFNHQTTINFMKGIFSIAVPELMVPLFLHLHAAYLAGLFQEAGMPIQYIMDILGPTGSRKTALAKLLFLAFDNKDVVNFQSTMRGIELSLEQAYDSTAVLDDLNNASDKPSVEKLERIIREIGDTAGRVKSTNGGKDEERTAMRVGLVVTAESTLDVLPQSSRLRNLGLVIDGQTIDNQALAKFQKKKSEAAAAQKPNFLENYLALFISYVEEHAPGIVYAIRERKVPFLTLKFYRQAEIYTQLALTARFVLDFWSEVLGPSEQIEVLYEAWIATLQKVMKQNQLRNSAGDPVLLFASAVTQLVTTGRLHISNSRKEYETESESVGYWQDESNFLILDPQAIYKEVVRYYKDAGQAFVISQQDLYSALIDRDLSEGYPQKDHKAKPLKRIKLNETMLSVLCLRWANVKRLVETDGQQE